MSLTTATAATNSIINSTGTSIGIGPAVTNTYWPPQEVESSRSHSFNCEQVENGWVLTFNRKHYVFENSSDMIAKMNALLVEKALAR